MKHQKAHATLVTGKDGASTLKQTDHETTECGKAISRACRREIQNLETDFHGNPRKLTRADRALKRQFEEILGIIELLNKATD